MYKFIYLITIFIIISCSTIRNVQEPIELNHMIIYDSLALEEPDIIPIIKEERLDNDVYIVESEFMMYPIIEADGKYIDNVGTIIYQIDTIFTVGSFSRVEAKITKGHGDNLPNNFTINYYSKSGEVIQKTLQVGKVMNMELTSLNPNAFIINDISTENQSIDNNLFGHWIWGVKPNLIGEYNLILKAIVKENDSNIEKIVFDEKINVINKPKCIYSVIITPPSELKKYEANYLYLKIYKDDNGTLKYGDDNSSIKIRVNNEENYTITEYGEYNFILNNNNNEYKWLIKPLDNSNIFHYEIILDGSNEDIVISENKIKVKNNYFYIIREILLSILKQWHIILSTLLIPLFIWIKKKTKNKRESK